MSASFRAFRCSALPYCRSWANSSPRMPASRQTSRSEAGEYQSLQIRTEFAALDSVPSIFKYLPAQDCSSYPARRGFTDLLQLANTPDRNGPAWTSAVNTAESYVGFSLKILVLPSTIVWIENHGRYSSPWNGRNCALGLEDACTFFDRGIPESSQENLLSRRRIRTHHDLNGSAFAIRYIQGGRRRRRDLDV
ncbi:MAG TPA: hypothetical protein VGB94_12055 [Acidobacteriaceae bacterium]